MGERILPNNLFQTNEVFDDVFEFFFTDLCFTLEQVRRILMKKNDQN